MLDNSFPQEALWIRKSEIAELTYTPQQLFTTLKGDSS